jgi:hypothetical protein
MIGIVRTIHDLPFLGILFLQIILYYRVLQ